MPKPLINILLFIGFGILSSIIGIFNHFTIIGNWPLNGIAASCYSFLFLFAFSLCFYGILQLKLWAYRATIICYCVNITILLFNFIIFALDINPVIQLKQLHDPLHAALFTPSHVSFTMFASFLLGVIFSLYILINLTRNKQFFRQ